MLEVAVNRIGLQLLNAGLRLFSRDRIGLATVLYDMGVLLKMPEDYVEQLQEDSDEKEDDEARDKANQKWKKMLQK